MLRPTAPRSLFAALVATALLAAGCGSDSGTETASLPFEPHAALKAVGGTVRTDKPDFVIDVTARPGDENIRSVAVNLPPVVLIDSTALGDICGKGELSSNECAEHKPVGSSHVLSPAFQGALTGPVYAVSGFGQLPRLIYLLNGPAHVRLEGRVVSKGGRIQAGVDDVPDTPLKTFELRINGGKTGYLILSQNICKGDPVADGKFTSQGGQIFTEKIPLTAECS